LPAAVCTQGAPSSQGLHEFEAIPKRVIDIHPIIAGKGLILDDLTAGIPEPANQISQVANEQPGVCLACRSKIGLNTYVDLDLSAFEPRTAAFGQSGRLSHFRYAEEPSVESASIVLPTIWHRELDVVNADDHSSLQSADEIRPNRIASATEPGTTA
jgi:hypothetical protein